jgi:hypothetical protein
MNVLRVPLILLVMIMTGCGNGSNGSHLLDFSGSSGVGTPPGAPTIGSATAGNTQATVSFTAPASDGGAPILLYTVTSTPGGLTASDRTSPITVTGLTNGTAYTFTVTATNTAGTSAPSAASNSVTPVATVPLAPSGVAAAVDKVQATVTFSPPASDGGSPITGYTVASNPAGGTDVNAGTTATTHTITGLIYPTSYSFTVTATNALGTSAASTASRSVALVNPNLTAGAITGAPLALASPVVSNLAGTVPVYTPPASATNNGSTNGIGVAAKFDHPDGITTDGSNLYVADTLNSQIRKIVIATGEVTTLAGEQGSWGYKDGVGTAAQIHCPSGITTDGAYLYVIDGNSRIRKIEIATGRVTTLTSGGIGYADGAATAAKFDVDNDQITTDGTNLYLTDAWNHTIRKVVIATGATTTLAGKVGVQGSANGIGTAATFDTPRGITTDGTYLYVAESGTALLNRGHSIRMIKIATGEVTTLAGGTFGNADGPGATASFNAPKHLTSDGTYLYLTDFCNDNIRKIRISDGYVTTVSGGPAYGYLDGPAVGALFSYPAGITTDGTSLFVAETLNHTIRKIR